jgi:hypothetical protein
MDQEREQACDDVVVCSGVDAADYAEHLVLVAAGLRADQLTSIGAMAMAQPSRLESRLLQVLDDGVNRRQATGGWRLGTVLLLLLCLIPIAMLQVAESAPQSQPWIADSSTQDREATGTATSAATDQPPAAAPLPAEAARKAHADRLQAFANALDNLGRVLETPEFKQPHSPQAGAASRMLYRMQALPAEDCYRLLKAWSFPSKDRDTIRHFIGLIPDAPPPAVFLQEAVPPLDDPIISTAVILVESARKADRLAELTADLKPFVDSNVDGALLLDQLLFQVREGSGAVRPRLSAVADEAEVDRQLLTAQRTANFGLVLWCYRAKALAAIEQTPGATLKPNPDPGLKHWVPVDMVNATGGNQFAMSVRRGSITWSLHTL